MDEAKTKERMLSSKEVRAITGLAHSTLWRWQQEGRFPARRVLGTNRIGWLESEVTEWMRTRPTAKI